MDDDEGVRIIGPVSQASAQIGVPPAEQEPELQSHQEQPPHEQLEEHEGSVDDLFARLREERQAAVIKAEKVLAPEPGPVDQAAESTEEPESSEAMENDVGEETVVADGDRLLLERRDECLEPVASDLVRRLKRVLQDEQNEILDRLRQSRGRTPPEEALPSAGDQAARYREAAIDPLAEAAKGGASFNDSTLNGNLPAKAWAQSLADELVGGLRDRVSRSLAAVGEAAEDTDVADSLGAAYRQWKTERIDQIARHHLAMAFNEGVLAGTPEGATLRWVFGDAGPCPDCDDNALAGPTPKGESYPTGQQHPPAHAGCGCLLVAAQA
jgi:hypothetical protein